jgi:hypothetical protein
LDILGGGGGGRGGGGGGDDDNNKGKPNKHLSLSACGPE